MREIVSKDVLLGVGAVLDLLDAGWRPGAAELEKACNVNNWGILPADRGAPFRIIAFAPDSRLRQRIFIAPVIAIDVMEAWARTFNAWLRIDEPLDNSFAVDASEVRAKTLAWLHGELTRQTTVRT